VVRNLPGYRFHQRFLQFLQHQDGLEGGAERSRWVLKCPEHLFALSSIRAVYPDARMVFVHRDPVKVLLSQARLTEVLRRPFTRRLNPRSIGPDESRRWLDGTRRMIAVGDDAGFPEPVCHIHHMDLISDPLSTVEAVYRHFGMTAGPGMAAAIEAYVAARPKGGYGDHHYKFQDHGLQEQEERDRFRPYMLRFGVTAEIALRQRTTPAATRVSGGEQRTLHS
jgi:hypothetical protein